MPLIVYIPKTPLNNYKLLFIIVLIPIGSDLKKSLLNNFSIYIYIYINAYKLGRPHIAGDKIK